MAIKIVLQNPRDISSKLMTSFTNFTIPIADNQLIKELHFSYKQAIQGKTNSTNAIPMIRKKQ